MTKLFYSNCEYILFSLLKYLIPTSLFLSDYNRLIPLLSLLSFLLYHSNVIFNFNKLIIHLLYTIRII